MFTSHWPYSAAWLFVLTLGFSTITHAEYEEEDGYQRVESDSEASAAENREVDPPPPAKPSKPKRDRKRERRHYVSDTNPEPRSDAGVFHVGAAIGGNFYTEPIVSASRVPTGEYSKDFGFQGGVYFDYDYSALTENVPLALRGFLGYKYILSSVHVFSFDGMVRRVFNWSDKVTFGLGFGGSAAVWYRTIEPGISTEEQIIFLPSVALGAGFEFNPFMVDFKWLINQFGEDSTRTGLEIYFGVRL